MDHNMQKNGLKSAYYVLGGGGMSVRCNGILQEMYTIQWSIGDKLDKQKVSIHLKELLKKSKWNLENFPTKYSPAPSEDTWAVYESFEKFQPTISKKNHNFYLEQLDGF